MVPPPVPALFDAAHRRLTTGIVLVVSFIAFEAIGVATALPAVLAHLGGVRLYGWAFSAFMLAQVAGIVVSGPVVDRVGMARPLTAAVALFAAGLLVGGLAPSMLVLVLGRAVQGTGAGVIAVTINVAVGRGYPPSLRPRAYAAMSSAWVVPGVVGPVIAGLVAQHLTWRLVFLALVPAVVVGAAIALPALRLADAATASTVGKVPGEPDASARRPGVLVALTLAVGSALVLDALATRHAVLAAVLAVGGLALAAPALVRVIPTRVAPPASRQLGAMAVGALANLAFFGAEAFLPLSLVSLHHRSLTEAGIVLTAASLTWTVGTWVQAHTQDRLGPRVLSAAGLGLVAVGVAGVAALGWSGTPWWTAFPAWAVAGGGMGLAYATTTLVVVSAAGPGRQGGPVAAMQVLITLGIAVGAGAGGAALAWSVALGHGRAPGLRLFDSAVVVVALVGVALTATVPRRVPVHAAEPGAGPGAGGAVPVPTPAPPGPGTVPPTATDENGL
ncbi:MAG TPA: MFS transporter [Acidimicrobiales bacterium]|nr:MFS transporter [Acidimicrobiales bacterium]